MKTKRAYMLGNSNSKQEVDAREVIETDDPQSRSERRRIIGQRVLDGYMRLDDVEKEFERSIASDGNEYRI